MLISPFFYFIMLCLIVFLYIGTIFINFDSLIKIFIITEIITFIVLLLLFLNVSILSSLSLGGIILIILGINVVEAIILLTFIILITQEYSIDYLK